MQNKGTKNFAMRVEAVRLGVVNTTDDDCEQQIPSVALSLHQSNNSCGLTPKPNRRSQQYLHIFCTTMAWCRR